MLQTKRSALFRGGTSGAAVLVARWWAQRHPGARVVALLPDEGERYVSTIYDDGWLDSNGLRKASTPQGPVLAGQLTEVDPEGWSSFYWGRRTFEQVTRGPYRPDDIR